MFPLRDHNPSGRTPYVVYALMAANILIFLVSLDFRGDERLLWDHYLNWAVFPVRITDGDTYYTLVTSTFLHGGFLHLAGNMLFLWIFGDNMEDQMGHGGFLVFYLVCGVAASMFQVMSNPDSAIPLVGASGAIAGVMGGYLLLFPKAQIDILLILIIFFRIFTIPAWILLGVWMGMQVFGGLGADPETGGVAYWAHGGGFVVGLVLTVPLWVTLGGSAFWRRTHGHPDHAPVQRRVKQWPGGEGPWGGGRPRPSGQGQPPHPDDLHWTPEDRSQPASRSSRPPLDEAWSRADVTSAPPSAPRNFTTDPKAPPRTAIPQMPSKGAAARPKPGTARAMAQANAKRAAGSVQKKAPPVPPAAPLKRPGQMPGSEPLPSSAPGDPSAPAAGQMPRITNRRRVKPVTRPGSPWQTRRK